MDNSLIFLLEENNDNKIIEKFINNVLTFNDEKFNVLFESIFNNYLLILFTISCFSSIFCCQNSRLYKYKLISQEDNMEKILKRLPV